MNYDDTHNLNLNFLTPCIVDAGVVINKQDMQRLLEDLHRVRYIHLCDGIKRSEGEGCIMEVFDSPHRSTIAVNHALYLNVRSFDYLELRQDKEGDRAAFDLIAEGRCLRLIPLSNPLQERSMRSLQAAALEAVVAEAICARLDAQLDDEEPTQGDW